MPLPAHITHSDADKLVEMATFLHYYWSVLQCVDAIDGSRILIIAPEEYLQNYPLVLQAVMDGKGLFLGCIFWLSKECA